jgi:hypothetical protein
MHLHLRRWARVARKAQALAHGKVLVPAQQQARAPFHLPVPAPAHSHLLVLVLVQSHLLVPVPVQSHLPVPVPVPLPPRT